MSNALKLIQQYKATSITVITPTQRCGETPSEAKQSEVALQPHAQFPCDANRLDTCPDAAADLLTSRSF